MTQNSIVKFPSFGLSLHNLQLRKPSHTYSRTEWWNLGSYTLILYRHLIRATACWLVRECCLMVHHLCFCHHDTIVMTTQLLFLLQQSVLLNVLVFSTPLVWIMGHARSWQQGQLDFTTMGMTSVHCLNKPVHFKLLHLLSAEFSLTSLAHSILPSTYQLFSLDWHLIRALNDHCLLAGERIPAVQRVSSKLQKWSSNKLRFSLLLSDSWAFWALLQWAVLGA